MNITYLIYFYSGSFLISMMYGSAFMLSIYMRSLHGNEMNMGNFLIYMGIGALFSVISLNKLLLGYITPLGTVIVGIAAYSLGLMILSIVTYFFHIYAVGFMMGMGWGLIYVASIIALTTHVPTHIKKQHLSYYAAINALGAGIAPIIFYFLNQYGFNLNHMYLMEGSFVGLMTIGCFLGAKKLERTNQDIATSPIKYINLFSNQHFVPLCATLMALLSACIFTTLTYFQVTFAEINHVNYTIFFSLITISIILSRLVLIHWISLQSNMLIYLSVMLTVSIILFLFINIHYSIYMISAVLFGLSYGLIFPLIQTISITYSDNDLHNTMVTYFILAYFIGIFGYPMISAVVFQYLNHTMIITLLVLISVLYTLSMSFIKKAFRIFSGSLLINSLFSVL